MTQVIECIPSRQRSANPELTALKLKQQAMWASGDFAVIGTTLQPVGEWLCEAADLQAGSVVLDVACGNGNATLAAARRFCNVTGIDYVPALLGRAVERARAERLAPSFIEGDAEELPFADAIFDAALSTFGVMFAADQPRAASELVRVVKPGGKIALASWTPEGFLGDLLRTLAHYVPAPKVAASPLRWGTTPGLAQLFDIGREVVLEHAQRRSFVFRYQSSTHFVDVFRSHYGPTHEAFEALDAEHQQALEQDLIELLRAHNQSRSALAVPGQYLEVVLQKLHRSTQS